MFTTSQPEFEKHVEIVNHVLTDFAKIRWASVKWIWSAEPKYRNQEANQRYPWLGCVQISSDLNFIDSKNQITADERYAVYLQSSTTYCIMAFRDYGSIIDGTSISYLYLIEVMNTCTAFPEELKKSIQVLYDYLRTNPVPIRTHGKERPAQLNTVIDTNSDVKIRTRVLAKHS
jgi:hypothetical protein